MGIGAVAVGWPTMTKPDGRPDRTRPHIRPPAVTQLDALDTFLAVLRTHAPLDAIDWLSVRDYASQLADHRADQARGPTRSVWLDPSDPQLTGGDNVE